MYFSVICPTYNSEKFICKTLESILNQSYNNYEVIFSDDGSKDNTLKILSDFQLLFKKKNIEIKILKNSHGGPGYARNLAIKLAKYDWISFIDSDDLWREDKLEKVSNFIKKNQNFNCILHRQHYIKLNNQIKFHNFDKYFNPLFPAHNQIFKSNFLAMSAITIKKELINHVGGFNENYQNSQDYDLWLRIGDTFKIHILKEYLGSNCEREGNITSRKYSVRIKNVIKILNENKKKVNSKLFYYRIFRILISLEWFKN
tara:strand:- start:4079 stop:4852 length:774 start_codon:yes stop_codon:yes gene_type:complete